MLERNQISLLPRRSCQPELAAVRARRRPSSKLGIFQKLFCKLCSCAVDNNTNIVNITGTMNITCIMHVMNMRGIYLI